MSYTLAQEIKTYFGEYITEKDLFYVERATEKVTWGYSLAFEMCYVRMLDSDFKVWMSKPDLVKYLVQVGWSLEHYQKIKI